MRASKVSEKRTLLVPKILASVAYTFLGSYNESFIGAQRVLHSFDAIGKGVISNEYRRSEWNNRLNVVHSSIHQLHLNCFLTLKSLWSIYHRSYTFKPLISSFDIIFVNDTIYLLAVQRMYHLIREEIERNTFVSWDFEQKKVLNFEYRWSL